MKQTIILCIVAGLFTGSVLGSSVWAEPAIQVPAVTYVFEGSSCGDSVVVDSGTQGNIPYLRFYNTAFTVSEDPRLTGYAAVDVVGYFKTNGNIIAKGSLILEPVGFAGTWVADFNLKLPGGKFIDVDAVMIAKDSQMNARGTGVFEGMWFFFEHGLAVSDPPYDIPVNGPEGWGCEFFGEIWAGKILDPNAK